MQTFTAVKMSKINLTYFVGYLRKYCHIPDLNPQTKAVTTQSTSLEKTQTDDRNIEINNSKADINQSTERPKSSADWKFLFAAVVTLTFIAIFFSIMIFLVKSRKQLLVTPRKKSFGQNIVNNGIIPSQGIFITRCYL